MAKYHDLRTAIIGVNVTFMILTTLSIGCRIGRKLRIRSSFSWHDVMITFAALFAVSFSSLQIATIPLGGGTTVATLRPENMSTFLKLVMSSIVLYFACNWFVKHSLLFFYAELTFERWHRRWIVAMHAIAFGFGFSCVLVAIFQCRPVHKLWDPMTPGWCIDMDAFGYFNSTFMLGNDVVLYAMPVVFTWNLKLRRPHRIAINCLFALGLIVLGASAGRVYFTHMQATEPDFPQRFGAAMICSVLENHLAVIVACAPSMKAVMIDIYPELQSKFEKILSEEGYSGKRYRSKGSGPTPRDIESGNQEMERLGIKIESEIDVKVEKPPASKRSSLRGSVSEKLDTLDMTTSFGSSSFRQMFRPLSVQEGNYIFWDQQRR